jgi:uncharacterized membrane protein YphA (DoxX/SURF4 family)
MAVGQAALFLSLFTLVVGAVLVGFTLGGIIFFHRTHAAILPNMKMALVTWMIYLAAAALLFFLPMIPLRARM